MSYRPFRNIGRFLVAACAVSFGVAGVSAQTTLPNAPNPSRVDLFAGYSYYGLHSDIKPSGEQFSSVNVGAIGSGAFFFNKYVGAEVNFMANPDVFNNGGQNDAFYGAYAGPIFRLPMQNYSLFAHGLAGGVRGVGPNIAGSTVGFNPYNWGAGFVAGGGMDYDLPFFNHHMGLRLFEADYRYTHLDFGPGNPSVYLQGGRANLEGVELSSGLLWHIGSIVPPPPIKYACAVTPTGTIYPGDPVTITGTADNLRPKKIPNYTWSSTSGAVSGSSNIANIDTKNLAAGSYTVTGHVEEGKKPGETADCTAQFTVTAFQPPTISCSANPSTLNAGEPATITASGVSPQNRPLTYSYSATAGSITGNTGMATLSTTGAAPGTTITVTCNVVDDKGQTASQQATVTLNAPPPPPAPVTSSLCGITFDKDKARPTRVDNEAKACLDDIALSAQRDTTSKLAIVGSSEPVKEYGRHTPRKEQRATEMAQKRAAERAVNEKEYLVKEKGLDPANISVYTGTAGTNSDATTLIPAGATLDTAGLTPVDESMVKAVPRKAVGMRHHHHHHHAAAATTPQQ